MVKTPKPLHLVCLLNFKTFHASTMHFYSAASDFKFYDMHYDYFPLICCDLWDSTRVLKQLVAEDETENRQTGKLLQGKRFAYNGVLIRLQRAALSGDELQQRAALY